ncbi:MAG: hypothetical protein K0S34_2632 [Bacillales bacterium]|nr:hypothetical protein [Bacillales bacterium]
MNSLAKDDKIKIDALTLSEILDVERTILANERTLLSFIRTSLTTLAAAVSLIQFFEHKVYDIVGYALVPIGLLVLLIGFIRHSNTKKLIRKMVSKG